MLSYQLHLQPERNSATKVGGDCFAWGTERILPQSRGLKATDSAKGSMA